MTLAIIIFPTLKPSVFEDAWRLGWSYYVACAACGLTCIQVFITFKIVDKSKIRKIATQAVDKPYSFNEQPGSIGGENAASGMNEIISYSNQSPDNIPPANNHLIYSNSKGSEKGETDYSSSRRSSSVSGGSSATSSGFSNYTSDESESRTYNHTGIEIL